MLRMMWSADAVVDEFTLRPGESTGWHYHLVPILAVVRSGTLTRVLHDGSVEVSPAGTMFVEAAGRDRVHIGSNHGEETVRLQVVYALPEGAPLTLDATPPTCCTAAVKAGGQPAGNPWPSARTA
ncbi:cupin domain-containing protein [Streptomyces sp. NPDC089799]|uniref:cupin domain-containing protein n=1 Tax=Streptomyces sp. NPDC089799 TaxID=3155066 RepID=UPI00344083C2